jgi:hypothetical protein
MFLQYYLESEAAPNGGIAATFIFKDLVTCSF